MFCKNCGKELKKGLKFCTDCGTTLISHSEIRKTSFSIAGITNKLNTGWIVKILVILAIIGYGSYSSLNSSSITKNNNAITSLDSGDSKTAVDQLQQATKDATENDTKINTLKNLAYAYDANDQADLELTTFKQALSLTSEGTSDYYLISGEVALLEGKPNDALLAYNKAYQMNPEDFQINNALALFYMDIKSTYPQYQDYTKALTYAKKTYEVNKLEMTKENLAIAYYFNENYSQTISLLSSSNFSQQPYAAYWLGLAYSKIDDSYNAKIYLQKAIAGGVKVSQEVWDYINSH